MRRAYLDGQCLSRLSLRMKTCRADLTHYWKPRSSLTQLRTALPNLLEDLWALWSPELLRFFVMQQKPRNITKRKGLDKRCNVHGTTTMAQMRPLRGNIHYRVLDTSTSDKPRQSFFIFVFVFFVFVFTIPLSSRPSSTSHLNSFTPVFHGTLGSLHNQPPNLCHCLCT